MDNHPPRPVPASAITDPDRPDEARPAEALADALGSIPDTGHEWDDDPAGWFRERRTPRRAD